MLFASGNGSNSENILQYFEKSTEIKVIALCCNNENAMVLERAKKYQIPTFVFDKSELASDKFLVQLQSFQPDLIVLAGFLLKLPATITATFHKKIINIHPSLLPKYGGKGMYGSHVHQAVLNNLEHETGITIHYVTENYDEGAVIFQKAISIADCSSIEEVAQKVHELEYQFFPQVIEQLLVTQA